MVKIPKVFISYSHDNKEHQEWVYLLACKLRENGIEVQLDQWDLITESNLPKFMEQGLSKSNIIIVICTDKYNKKSNDGLGGVGYEKNIITSEIMYGNRSKKIIPCIRKVSTKQKTPICITHLKYIDFSDESNFETSFKELIHNIFEVPIKHKPILGNSPFHLVKEHPIFSYPDSIDFFNSRFRKAFPGNRGIEYFNDPKSAIERLSILLKKPLTFRKFSSSDEKFESFISPIWWWRDGDNSIKDFKVINENTIRISYVEYIIEQVAAISSTSDYHNFVYIKTSPSSPSELYTSEEIQYSINEYGYCSEEYGLYNGIPIRSEEYDDGAAIINGKVVELKGKAKYVKRFITPYNFLIAPFNSPIMNQNFDSPRVEILNMMLQNKLSVENLSSIIKKLPKPYCM